MQRETASQAGVHSSAQRESIISVSILAHLLSWDLNNNISIFAK